MPKCDSECVVAFSGEGKMRRALLFSCVGCYSSTSTSLYILRILHALLSFVSTEH